MTTYSSESTGDACSRVEPLIAPFCDGELDAVQTVEIEEHIARCAECREQVSFSRALKRATRDASTDDDGAMPTDMRARLVDRIRAEAASIDAAEAESVTQIQPEASKRRPWAVAGRAAVPLAAAAAIALAWGSVARAPAATGGGDVVKTAGITNDIVHDLVAEHSRPLPPERTDPREVRQLERYVGVPVRVPKFGANKHMHFVGGRVLAVNHERTAMLQYEVGEGPAAQRVSVFVYDPRRIRAVRTSLSPRAIGTAQVHVGRADGYTVAVVQRDGVGYALASDLDPEASAELVARAEYVDP